MTRAERQDLARLARMRAKLARDHATARGAELQVEPLGVVHPKRWGTSGSTPPGRDDAPGKPLGLMSPRAWGNSGSHGEAPAEIVTPVA